MTKVSTAINTDKVYAEHGIEYIKLNKRCYRMYRLHGSCLRYLFMPMFSVADELAKDKHSNNRILKNKKS